MDHENKKVVKIGHNSNRSLTAEIGEDISHELQQLRKAYRRLKDKMCDNISLMLDLQETDLEDVRVSTRVADRFKNLQLATEKNESVQSTINALKPLAYSHKTTKQLDEWTWNKFRDEYGDDVAAYELEYENVEIKYWRENE
jgi:pyridoxine 5'-phosphate synthase PdxJ